MNLRWPATATYRTDTGPVKMAEIDPEFAEPIARLAQAMSDKLVKTRERYGSDWLETPVAELWGMLKDHVDKGDPVDVANFAMMIHARMTTATTAGSRCDDDLTSLTENER